MCVCIRSPPTCKPATFVSMAHMPDMHTFGYMKHKGMVCKPAMAPVNIQCRELVCEICYVCRQLHTPTHYTAMVCLLKCHTLNNMSCYHHMYSHKNHTDMTHVTQIYTVNIKDSLHRSILCPQWYIHVCLWSSDIVLLRMQIKFGQDGFCFSGPAAENALCMEKHYTVDSRTFKKWLKTVW